jgi:hypothetical protein
MKQIEHVLTDIETKQVVGDRTVTTRAKTTHNT